VRPPLRARRWKMEEAPSYLVCPFPFDEPGSIHHVNPKTVLNCLSTT
jgi:hypothetical protein